MTLNEKMSDLVDGVSDWDRIVEDCTYSEGDKSNHLYKKIYEIGAKHLKGMFGGPVETDIAINAVLEKVFSENNIKCFSVSSVKKGVEELEKYNDNYVKIIFGSHYIAEEVYNATGKHFDTTNN
mgnify:CR=1 FL=1